MPIIEGTRKPGGQGLGSPKPAYAVYDFATDGGDVGAITLRGDSIPSGAVITDALLRVSTALAGGTVTDTLSLGSEAATDLQSAAARNAAPWSTTGAKRLSLTATTAPVLTTEDRDLTLTVNGTGLTAGAFKLVVWYVELS